MLELLQHDGFNHINNKIMFWKIFAWINLFITLSLLVSSIFFNLSVLRLVDVAVFFFNDLPLLTIPLLFAYKKYDIKYFSNIVVLKTILIFTIIYNVTNIVRDLSTYNFTTIFGLIFDLSFYVLTILAITAFALYIMFKFKITFFQIFTK